jgi:glycosyltransferase involved in cell wall biosynthesis
VDLFSSPPAGIAPDNARFVLLCFEGPDRYSLAGGLGTRMRELSHSLAQRGFQTDLFFVGDPNLPGEETQEDGRLTLHRWCQWISAHHPVGVYDGENSKLEDFARSVPPYVIDQIVEPSVTEGKLVVVLAEEWHTAWTTIALSDRLHALGLRDKVLILWNANNTMGFEYVPWDRLPYTATLTTVSKFMKQIMWDYGVNPIVIPNGIPERLLTPPPGDPMEIRRRLGERLLLAKVARFDPDKRWLQAISAAAEIKRMGIPFNFIMRGGLEAHGADVMHLAQRLGLKIAEIYADGRPNLEECFDIIERYKDCDILNLRFFLPEEFLRCLYRAADAVLANSGREPFGLVGLEVMAEGGVAVTGASGEDYARSFENALCIETDDPLEIVGAVLSLASHPDQAERLRQAGRAIAERFTWNVVIDGLLRRLEMLAYNQGLTAWSGLPK